MSKAYVICANDSPQIVIETKACADILCKKLRTAQRIKEKVKPGMIEQVYWHWHEVEKLKDFKVNEDVLVKKIVGA